MNDEIVVYPVQYPPKPPADDEIVYQAVIPLFNARSWAESAAKIRQKLRRERNDIEKKRLQRMVEGAEMEIVWQMEKLVRLLADLPSDLRAKADKICGYSNERA